MPKFEVGDKDQTPGVPFTVEVLEIGVCKDSLPFGTCESETFRFKDPQSGRDDWMHTDEFERVAVG